MGCGALIGCISLQFLGTCDWLHLATKPFLNNASSSIARLLLPHCRFAMLPPPMPVMFDQWGDASSCHCFACIHQTNSPAHLANRCLPNSPHSIHRVLRDRQVSSLCTLLYTNWELQTTTFSSIKTMIGLTWCRGTQLVYISTPPKRASITLSLAFFAKL